MYIYGKNVAKEKLRSREEVFRIFLSRKFHDEEIFSMIRERGIKTIFLDNQAMDRKVSGNHQGIILEVEEVRTYSLDYFLESVRHQSKVLVVMLDHLEDPHNFGAISYMKIVRVPNLGSTITRLKKEGFWIVGTDMDGEDYSKIDYPNKVCVIIGNEGKGVSETLLKKSDFVASIPMSGKINSLNASVSCGIILSEIVLARRR